MIAYLVERVYSDPTRPNAMLSIWSSFERAQAWAERHRADAADADLAIRVREIGPPAHSA